MYTIDLREAAFDETGVVDLEILVGGKDRITISVNQKNLSLRIPGGVNPSSIHGTDASFFLRSNDFETENKNHVHDWDIYNTRIVPTPWIDQEFIPEGWIWYTNLSGIIPKGIEVYSRELRDKYGSDCVKIFKGAYWKDGRFDPNAFSIWIYAGVVK